MCYPNRIMIILMLTVAILFVSCGGKSPIEPPDGTRQLDLVDITPQWLSFSPEEIITHGNYAYILCKVNDLVIFNIENPYNPYFVKSVDLKAYPEKFCVTDKNIYVCCYSDILKIIDINPPESAHVAATVEFNATKNPSKIIFSNGYLFRTFPYSTGLEIVKYVNGELQVVKTVDVSSDIFDFSISNRYLYLVTNSEIIIVDISEPESPQIVSSLKVLPPVEHCNGIGLREIRIHDGYAYVSSSKTIHIVDIDPVNEMHEVSYVVAPGYIKDFTANSDYATIAISSYRLAIADINPPESAHIVKVNETNVEKLDIVGKFVFGINDSSLQVIDLSPGNLRVVKYINSPTGCGGLHTTNGYAYISSSYRGVEILDIDPAPHAYSTKIVELPYGGIDICTSDGYIYATTYSYGMYIIDAEPINDSHVVNHLELSFFIYDIFIDGNYAYVTTGDEYQNYLLKVININPPESAHMVGEADINGYNGNISVSNGYAYVVSTWYYEVQNEGFGDYCGGYLEVLDVTQLDSPVFLNCIEFDYRGREIIVDGNYAYIAATNNVDYGCMPPLNPSYRGSFLIFDISIPADPQLVNDIYMPEGVLGIAIRDDIAFIACNSDGLWMYDISNPESVSEISSFVTHGRATDVSINDKYVLISNSNYYPECLDAGLQILQLN